MMYNVKWSNKKKSHGYKLNTFLEKKNPGPSNLIKGKHVI